MYKIGILSLATVGVLFANSTKLETSVISTTGFEDTLENEVRNLNIITRDDIEKRSYKNLKEILRNTPGLYVGKKVFGDTIDMRGQGNKANTNVQIMINGVSMNTTDSSHTSMPFDAINIDDIERIEIVPGGGSVLYGSGTQGGIINIITKSNRKEFYANIASRYQSAGSINGRFNVGGMLGENLFLKAGFFKDDNKGYRYGEKNDGTHGSFGAQYQINDYQNIGLNFSHYSGERKTAGGVSKKELDENRRSTDGDYKTTDIKLTNLNLDYNIKFNENWQFNTTPFYQKTKFSSKNSSSIFEDKKTGLRNKIKYDYDFGNLIFGYDYIYNKGKNNGSFDFLMPNKPPKPTMRFVNISNGSTKKTTNSFYLQNKFDFTDTFSLTAGYRYDHAKYEIGKNTFTKIGPASMFNKIKGKQNVFDLEKSENNYAFEIIPNFKYSDTGNIYFKFERGFTSPSANKMQNKDKILGYYPSNINSETFNTYELGMKDLIFGQFFQAAIFYTKSKDEIATTGQPPHYWEQHNIGETQKWGIELGLGQTFMDDRLSFSESFSYIDTEVKKSGSSDFIVGEVVPNVPKYKLTISADYDITQNFGIFADSSFYGDQKNEDYKKISSYNVTGVGARYKYKNLSVTAGVDNIFDKEYYTSVSGKDDKASYVVGDGRTAYIEFKYDF